MQRHKPNIELQITHATDAGEENINWTNAGSSRLSALAVVKWPHPRVCWTPQKPDKTIPRKAKGHKPQPIKQLSEKEEEPVEILLNHLGEDNNAI